MASALAEYVKDASDKARHSIWDPVRSAKREISGAHAAWAIVGAAALIGAVAATIYYTPDFVRYMKIKRM